MFERYTEAARRVLFFTRYETSALGGAVIESEHLLLGLVREAEGTTRELLARANVSLEGLRKEIRSRARPSERVPTSVEIPFSPDTKRILESAAAEAEGLGHHDIGTEHLLLGMLRERDTAAGRLLVERGLDVDTVRREIASMQRTGR